MSAFSRMVVEHANLLDPQGLEANRRGDITEAQKQRLTAMLGRGDGWGALMAIFILGLFLCFLFFLFVVNKTEDALIPLLVTVGVLILLFSLMGRNLWKLWEKGVKFRRDSANRAIYRGQGQLSYRKKGYVLQADDRDFALPVQDAGGLQPGVTYRVYYLEESSLLLSAEEIHPTDPAQVRAAVNEILATANQFSLEDLAANRNGHVTPEQRLKLLSNVFFGAAIILMTLIFVTPFFLSPISSNPRDAILAFVFVLVIVGILPLLGGIMVVNALIDMFVSALQQVQGAGHKEKRISGGKHHTIHYYYVVGGLRFEIGYGAYSALINGLEYCIYYLPRTKRLMTIEALSTLPQSSLF